MRNKEMNHVYLQKIGLEIKIKQINILDIKKQMTIKDKRRKTNEISITGIMVILCCLRYSIAQSVTDYKYDSNNYMLALKNEKLFAIKYDEEFPLYINEYQLMNLIYIHNNQQFITVEVPVYKQNQLRQHYISNLTHIIPLWSDLLYSKGYLKPFNPFNSSINYFLKGYRYSKPSYHDSTPHQLFEEIQTFIKNIIQINNLTSLNIRMEDTFTLRVQVRHANPIIEHFKVNGLNLRYLFATVGRETVPEWIRERVETNLIGFDKYLKDEKASVLERRLYGKGLHQWINHTITLDDTTDIELQFLGSSCFFEFTDILPESTYIDADQRSQQTTNYEIINVQLPAFASKQYFYKYRVAWSELKETGVRKYSYHQPVHFRYPAPSLLNYTKVYLHPIDQVRIVCEAKDQRQDRSEGSEGSEEVVFKVEENLLFERGTASIPNADISKAKIVSTTTLVVCLVAALVIIRQLK